MDEIVKDFLIESNENLDRLDQELVKLESCPSSKELLAGDFHMEVQTEDGSPSLRTHQGPRENVCRPSVDVLFRSVNSVYRGRVLE